MTRYALVIGIAEYSTNSFRSLDTPVHNANAIASILDQHGDFNQVKRLPFRRERGQPELGQVIRKALPHDQLVQEIQQFLHDADGSDVLIYYSGHGFTKVDALSQTPEGYLAPSDCQLEINANGQVIAQKNGVSLFGLNELIKQHRFNNLVVILDCCNSGAFLESAMVRRDATVFGYQLDYYLITACRSSSKSYEGEEYSLLTQAILKGLSPENALPLTGRISGDRLFDAIGNELYNKRQEPIRMGWGRLITLVRYPLQSPSGESSRIEFNPANPYIGLKPFDRDQADYFFGRDIAVRALLDRLSEHRFLAVLGSSGSGKSSLVRAGLFPELESDRIPGSQTWIIERITPGQFPLQELARVLDQHRTSDRPLLLFVDQFEELFTLCPDEADQRRFIKRLDEESSRTDIQTRIIIAMRGDFLDRCAKFQESADLINSTAPTTYVVTPLTEARLVSELEEAITCPAKLHGVSLAHNLTSHIVGDVINQPGAMPLLQYAVRELWESSISATGASRQLTLESYQAIGGVKGALQRWADEFYANLSPTDQLFLRDMISELVQIGDDGEVTRRRATWDRLREIAASSQQLERIVGKLIDQRLLVADDKTVEVAHEALLREARLIQGWIEENRDSIRLQQRLETYRHEWQEHDRSANYLLESGRLAAIDDWIEKKQPRLTQLDQEFISQSREKRDRLFQSQLEQERQLREAAERRELLEIEKKLEAEARAEESTARIKIEKQKNRLFKVVVILLLGLATLAYNLKQKSDQQEKVMVEASIIEPQQLFSDGKQLEALLSSLKTSKYLSIFRKTAPLELQNIVFKVQEINRLERHLEEVQSIRFSPDGKQLVSSGRDNSVILWDENGRLERKLNYQSLYGVWHTIFNKNGDLIASADTSGIVKLWNLKTWIPIELKSEKLARNEYATSISFSPNNGLLASAISNDIKEIGRIEIWDLKTNKIFQEFGEINKFPKIFSISFSPTENILVFGDVDGNVRLLDINTKEVKTWKAHKDVVKEIVFSSDGKIFATTGDTLVKIWRVSDTTLIRTLSGHEDVVKGIAIDSGGKRLASASKDRTVRIWDINTGSQINLLRGHTGTVNRVSFNSNGNKVASASDDKTIRIWNIDAVQISSSEQMTLDSLSKYGCNLIKNYLLYNSKIAAEDKKTCEGN